MSTMADGSDAYRTALAIADPERRADAFRELALARARDDQPHFDEDPGFWQARALVDLASGSLAADNPDTSRRLLAHAAGLAREFADPVDRSSTLYDIRQVMTHLDGKDPRGRRIQWESISEDDHHAPLRAPEEKAFWNRELRAEIGEGHQLHGKELDAVAVLKGSDDVVVRVRDEAADEPVRYVVVHLTFNLRPEPPPWPTIEADVTFSGHW
jgi:hypothetical protein